MDALMRKDIHQVTTLIQYTDTSYSTLLSCNYQNKHIKQTKGT